MQPLSKAWKVLDDFKDLQPPGWKPLRLALTPTSASWSPFWTLLGVDLVEKAGQLWLCGMDGWAWDVVVRFQLHYGEYLKKLAPTPSLLTDDGLLAYAWSRLRQQPALLDGAEALAMETLYSFPTHQAVLDGLRELGLLPVTLNQLAAGLKAHLPPLRASDDPEPPPIEDDDGDDDEDEPVHADGHPF